MFNTFFSFEIKNWLRSPMLYIFLFLIATLVFFAVASENLQIGGSAGNVHRNAPMVIISYYTIFSIFTISLTTAFINGAAIRDFENNTQQIIFSKPINKANYFFGHWLGGIISATLPMLGVSLGVLFGSVAAVALGWQDADRFGAIYFSAHATGFLIFVVPNIIFTGSIIFTISSLTRNTLYSYVASVLILVAYLASGNLIRDLGNDTAAALLDPFGGRTASIITKYWTVDEKNSRVVAFDGLLLSNRLIWLAIAFAVLLIGYFRFSFSERTKKGTKEKADNDYLGLAPAIALPTVKQVFDGSTTRTQLWSQYKTNSIGILRSIPFLILTFISIVNLVPNFFIANEAYGTSTFPITINMCDKINGAFSLFSFSLMTYFAGILIWKERDAKVDEIFDTLPTRTWTSYAAKFFAVATAVLIMLTIAVALCMGFQTLKGYYNYELGVYFQQIFVLNFIATLFLLAAFMLIHVLVNNKYIGFFVCIIFFIANGFLWQMLQIKSNMVNFGSTPSATYSDMAKLTPFVSALTAFNLYWFLFCLLLAFLSVSFWVRGKQSDVRTRLRLFNANVKSSRGVAFGLLGVWAACAGWVFYNTEVLNAYKSDKKEEVLRVEYEKQYKKYRDAALPSYAGVKYDISIFPAERKLTVKGDIFLKNNNARAIDTLFISQLNDDSTYVLKIANTTPIFIDKKHGFLMLKLNAPLTPNDSVLMHFESSYAAKGFENQVTNTSIIQNGTFINNQTYIPLLGYQSQAELTDKNKRKSYGLPLPERMPKLDSSDKKNRLRTDIGGLDSWIDVETTISTSDDQIAIAPGSLVKEWKKDGRHYFNYKLDHASLNFYSFISAKYEVARRKFYGVDLEVYYHNGHPYNIQHMLDAMEKSLTYYTTHFGPYYHKECRIIEFPRYASFAQSFPGTMPYSESFGFVQNLKNPNDFDLVTAVIAHEIGHQYWAHQECGANMQGANLLTETLSQYSSMMVIEKNNSPEMVRKYLKYENDRYLQGRGFESLHELPLSKVESAQSYAYYRKGSAVMYYLKEMIGEDNVNLSLRAFLEKFRYQTAPFPTSLDLTAEFRKNTPDSLQYIIKDLFDDITLFNNRTTNATYKKLPNGKFEVTIKTISEKFKANELGKETEVPVNDYIDIGAVAKTKGDAQPKILYRARQKITQKDNTFSFVVDEIPEEAGIDPIYLLIDRVPSDNLKRVTENK